ncbi:MAG: hypothetical protein M3Z64_08815, partial [Verrucomicrobiota bacterium]|nr:hypothetical protein [Verrucomicrobiota bacterium]
PTALSGSYPGVLWVKPSDPRVVLTGNGFPTQDCGDTLDQIASARGIKKKTSDLAGTVLYGVAGASAIARSDDVGKTWQLMPLVVPVVLRELAIDPSNPDVVYAGSISNSFRSWGVLKSIDRGVTWVVVTRNDRWIPLVVDRADPHTIYGYGNSLGDAGHVGPLHFSNVFLKSTDGGVSWRLPAGGQGIPVTRILQNPNAPNNLYAMGPIGVFRSMDSGENWESLNAGLPNRKVYDGAVIFGDSDTVLAVCSPGSDAFVSKLSADGSTLIYRTQIGGSADDRVAAMAVDTSGEVWVAGDSESADFPAAATAYQQQIHGLRNAFAARLGIDGQQLNAASLLGGSLYDSTTALALIPDGIAIAGSASSIDFPVTDATSRAIAQGGTGEGFVSIFSPDLASLRYSLSLGRGFITGLVALNGSLVISGSAAFPNGSIFLDTISY